MPAPERNKPSDVPMLEQSKTCASDYEGAHRERGHLEVDRLMQRHHEMLLADLGQRLDCAEQRIIDHIVTAATSQAGWRSQERRAGSCDQQQQQQERSGPTTSANLAPASRPSAQAAVASTNITAGVALPQGLHGERREHSSNVRAGVASMFAGYVGRFSMDRQTVGAVPEETNGPGSSEPLGGLQHDEAVSGRQPRETAADIWAEMDRQRMAAAGRRGTNDVFVEDARPKKNCLQRLMSHTIVEAFFCLIILCNAVVIAVQTEYSARMVTTIVPEVFFIVNIGFTVVFAVELMLKLLADRLGFFTNSERYWNYMDFVVATSSVLEVVIDLNVRLSGHTSEKGVSASQFRLLRITRILRIVRLARVSRVLKMVRALRTMVYQIFITLKSLVWAVFLILMMIFLFATVFTQSVIEHIVHTGSEEPLLRYWSTLPRSMLTLYQMITGGVNWDEVAKPLADASVLSVGLLFVYVAFTQLAVLNVITGVFCQNAIESAKHDEDLVTQSMLAEKEAFDSRIQQLFQNTGVDLSGSITIQKFIQILDDDGVRAFFSSMEIDTRDVWMLFKLLDQDEGNEIELDEFISGCLRLKGAAKAVDLSALSYDHKLLMKQFGKFMTNTQKSLQVLEQGQLLAKRSVTGSPVQAELDKRSIL